MIKKGTYAGFEVALATGSKRKQLLSNRLSLRVPGERSEVEIHLTLRQAHALKKFLNDNV
jgi:hypothetical protein